VRVPVQGELYALATEEMLNVLRVDATSQQQSRAGVPEIVERYVGQANTLKDRLEMLAGDVPGVEGRAVAGRKHKAVISPFSASPKLLFLYLPLAMASEGFYGPLRQVYGPSTTVLRL
jgi:hypothetical protein